VNKGFPPDLKKDSKSLKRAETTFRRKGMFFFSPGGILVL
jgi:hypothetical protein